MLRYAAMLTVRCSPFHCVMLAMLCYACNAMPRYAMLAGVLGGDESEDERVPPARRSRPLLSIEGHTAHSHRVARQVLRRITADMVDIREHWVVRTHLGDIDVKLDNASHASGIQRVYTACGCRAHHACFRYAQVIRFVNVR